MSWYRLDLGDAQLADDELGNIRRQCRATFERAGAPPGWAVYQAHVSGNLHCRAQIFFSPGAAELARDLGARRCDVLPEELGLVAGDGAGLFDYADLFRGSQAHAALNLKGDHTVYLSAEDIAAMAGRIKTHFLNDNAVRNNKSLGDAVGLERLGVHLITVDPGRESTEYHVHHYEEECTYVLSGTGAVILGDDRQTIGPGDFIGYPTNGVAHTMINDGNEPLVCLVIGQRLTQDVGDYPQSGKRLYRNSGRWDLVDLEDIERVDR